ncbi:MAG: multidrug transporter [Rhodospirillaceae bacterium]|nr:multidrug transporter [Rhodospirillaceae bacterium]
MEPTLFKFIWRYSKRDQILLLVLTGLSFPFLYFSLDLPKQIINKAIGGKDIPENLFGFPVDQVEYLMVLSGAFLVLVCINGAFKFYVNVFRGQLGERMLRRLRYGLYSRVLRFPLPHFRRVSQGEVIQMITGEVEPLGGFVGDSIALPAFQGGTLLTILVFMFVQDWVLGLAAIALYPIQGYLIPKLQWHVNQLGKARVRNVRRLSEKIGESISGIQEVHANDGARWALAGFTDRLGTIYDIRYEIYRRKFFIKFLNNFIAQLTPFFFYSIGGYLVIKGDLTFGALVAILAAYKDLSAPWKELLTYYQRLADSKIKYDQVIEQFDPAGTLPEDMQTAELERDIRLAGPINAANISVLDEESQPIVENLSFNVEAAEKVAVVGPSGGGKDVATMLLARLLMPDNGRITITGEETSTLPEAVTGRRIGYVGPTAYVFNATLKENILLGAMHQPVEPAPEEPEGASQRKANLENARLSGNSEDETDADWIDYAAIGVEPGEPLDQRLADLLQIVDLDEDTYNLGLRGTIDPEAKPDVAERVLIARSALREKLSTAGLSDIVESFDTTLYNANASVAENLLFGTPVGTAFALENIADNDYVRAVLDKTGLTEDFVRIGRDVASTMVELFADLPPDHEFFTQYSFISAEDLPDYQILIGRAERLGLDGMAVEDRERFIALPFKLIPARHRLGMIDDGMRERILEARAVFAKDLPADLRGSVEFFSADAYNAAASLQDNVLFGKVAYGQADASSRVSEALAEVIAAEGLRGDVIRVGLEFEVGVGGARISASQRQKVGIARTLLRRPDILIFNEAAAAIDTGSQNKVMSNIFDETEGRGVVWALQRASLAETFDRVLVMRGGRITESGSFAELRDADDSALKALLAEE